MTILYQIRDNPEILLNENNINGNGSTWIFGENCFTAGIGCSIFELIFLMTIGIISFPILMILEILFPTYICGSFTSTPPLPPC
jgi:hypothetical protein